MYKLSLYSCMLSHDVISSPHLMDQAKLCYLKKLLPNKYLQEAALSFMASRKLHEEIESAEKRAMFIIFKGHTNYSLNSLLHKQLIQKVTATKSFVKPETLLLTESALIEYQSFQAYLQIMQQNVGRNLHATEWCWAAKPSKFISVLTDLEAATQYILKIIRSLCIIDCSSS